MISADRIDREGWIWLQRGEHAWHLQRDEFLEMVRVKALGRHPVVYQLFPKRKPHWLGEHPNDNAIRIVAKQLDKWTDAEAAAYYHAQTGHRHTDPKE